MRDFLSIGPSRPPLFRLHPSLFFFTSLSFIFSHFSHFPLPPFLSIFIPLPSALIQNDPSLYHSSLDNHFPSLSSSLLPLTSLIDHRSFIPFIQLSSAPSVHILPPSLPSSPPLCSHNHILSCHNQQYPLHLFPKPTFKSIENGTQHIPTPLPLDTDGAQEWSEAPVGRLTFNNSNKHTTLYLHFTDTYPRPVDYIPITSLQWV